MNELYKLVSKKTGGAFDNVRFPSLSFDGSFAVVNVVCAPSELDGIKARADELKKIVSSVCAFHSTVRLDIRSVVQDETSVRSAVVSFIDRFPFLRPVSDVIKVESPVSVSLKMHKSMYSLSEDIVARLSEYLDNSFLEHVDVKVEVTEYTPVKKERAKPIEQKRDIKYTPINIIPVIGETEESGEVPSAAAIEGNGEDVRAVGILAMPTEFMSKGTGAKRSRPYEKFLLFDGDTSLQCRFFPHGDNGICRADLIGKTVFAVGNTQVERGRIGETSMTVRSIALCTAPVRAPEYKNQPKEYKTVFPAQYEEYVQANLFDPDDVLPEALRGVFVAFDFETTGLNVAFDKPTELGAVKIVDGVLTETFHTLIDPQRPIPDEVSQKTGITDDMVAGKPLLEEVLPDFYKFTYGCSLVGHNIAFDFPFLLKYGNRYGWSFCDRKTFDTLGLAPNALPGIEVLTLDSVLARLGLVNDNAHRALSDAVATAKAFIAMQKLIFNAK